MPLNSIEARLRRYPADRYPIQHAAAQFQRAHWLMATDLAAAHDALDRCVEIFAGQGLVAETAKSLNARGALRRTQRRLGEAEADLVAAAELLGGHLDRRSDRAGPGLAEESTVTEGAALFNLGLVLGDQGRDDDALRALVAARIRLGETQPGHRNPAEREIAAVLLRLGRPEEACRLATGAAEHARHSGERAALGLAANLVGLAHLAMGESDRAAEAFEEAAAAHARTLAPDGHVTAHANLALACERAGQPDRAVVAARVALGAGPAAAEQTAAIVISHQVAERIGPRSGALVRVVAEGHRRLAGEDTQRWAGLAQGELSAEAEEVVSALIERAQSPDGGGDGASALLAEWLGIVVELPPPVFDAVASALGQAVGGLDTGDRALFASVTDRAIVRFPLPQWSRLGAALPWSRSGDGI